MCQRLHRGPRLRDLLQRMVVQPDRCAVPGDGDDLGRGQRADADGDCLKGVHGIYCTANEPR